VPLFRKDNQTLNIVKQKQFLKEKDLQHLIENNLDIIFNCKFVASEFFTGQIHSGRIDTLALSEDSNPVIIEYKAVESSDLINQSLFYLSWIKDHKGDFKVECNKTLGNVEVDWSDVRVICIAPGYKKYDLHAVQVMGANIELWEYRLYEDGAFVLEEVLKKSDVKVAVATSTKPTLTNTGKKVAGQKAPIYSIDDHFKKANNVVKELLKTLQEYILDIDESVEEVPKKFYIAYKFTQNFVCIEVKKDKLLLFLKINPDEINPLPKAARDVRKIGHFGTGDFEYTLTSGDQLEEVKQFIRKSYENIGG
jgi:predicted transport protein